MTKAMVMAAGLGTRMRPLTDTIPKPLVPVSGVPLIDRLLDWLDASDVEEAVVNSHYRAAQLEAHLSKRTKPRVRTSHEEVLLDTGGGIKKSAAAAGRPAVLCHQQRYHLHRRRDARAAAPEPEWNDGLDALLLIHPVDKAIGYPGKGDFFLNNDGTLRRGEGKPAPYVFTGVQMLHPRLFKNTPEGVFSLNVLYTQAMQCAVNPQRMQGLVHDGDWLHVGDVDGLKQAEAHLATL